jgi:DNA-binding transcriptional MerR regulator
MSEPLYTTDFLEEYFGITKDYIHRLCHEFNIKPVRKVQRYGSPNGKNLYSEEQKQRLERILNSRAQKQANKVVYIESVYVYRESRMNNPDNIL